VPSSVDRSGTGYDDQNHEDKISERTPGSAEGEPRRRPEEQHEKDHDR
jgi:hypothetical protein